MEIDLDQLVSNICCEVALTIGIHGDFMFFLPKWDECPLVMTNGLSLKITLK